MLLYFVPASVYVERLCGQHSYIIYVKWVKAHAPQGNPYEHISRGSWSLAEEENHSQVFFKPGVSVW